MRFLVSCAAGLQDVVASQLAREGFGPVKLQVKEEGFLVFDAVTSQNRIRALTYLNTAFVVLKAFAPSVTADLDFLLEQLYHERDWHLAARKSIASNERTFRLMVKDGNSLVAGDKKALRDLATAVRSATRLTFTSRGGDTEFWLIRRRSGDAFFCKRIAMPRKTEKDLQKGELRPELAHLLCLMSEPRETDIFLDPFAGSGAIPKARRHIPYRTILASDRDTEKVRSMRIALKIGRRPKGREGLIKIRQADARHLTHIEDSSVDKVVTDPPWGLYDESEDYSYAFYRDVLFELTRVTKPGGVIIIMLGREDVAAELASEFGAELSCLARTNILVSGKKAVVLKWQRKA